MAMRTVALRLCGRSRASLSRSAGSRSYSEGRALSEEERAQENIYIKKMEKEKLEKARQAAKAGTPLETETGSSSTASSSVPGPSTDSSTNIAVFAGIVAVLALGAWYFRSGSKKEEVKK